MLSLPLSLQSDQDSTRKRHMSGVTNEYELQSYLRQSAHRLIDERHSLSNERWDLERRFVVLTDQDLLDTGSVKRSKPNDEGPAMNSLLDSLTTMCVCISPRQPPKWCSSPARKKRRVVYPVEGFSPQVPLNAKHVVKKRLSKLQSEHFFRPVSEDELMSM